MNSKEPDGQQSEALRNEKWNQEKKKKENLSRVTVNKMNHTQGLRNWHGLCHMSYCTAIKQLKPGDCFFFTSHTWTNTSHTACTIITGNSVEFILRPDKCLLNIYILYYTYYNIISSQWENCSWSMQSQAGSILWPISKIWTGWAL